MALVAAAAALLALSNVMCRVACRGRGGRGADDTSVVMICPHCGTVYRVSAKDVGVDPEAIADVVQERAASAPCPKCGKTDGVAALTCPKCGKPFAPPKTPAGPHGPTCPHCGARLWEPKR